jgi:serine/threonine protein kinase
MHPTDSRHARRPGEPEKAKKRTTVELTPCGPFRLGEVVGHSATATVFLATRSGNHGDDKPGPFAVKKLTSEGRDGVIPREQIEAFVREIRLMRRIQHRAIVEVIDSAASPAEDPYLVMELLEGLPLDRVGRRLQRTQDTMSSALAAFVAQEVADGLSHVHNLRDDQGRPLGAVHGGLRPKEIYLLRSGEAKLLAFGPGNTGTPAVTNARRRRAPATYRAPEQILGRPIDARTDLFSLGAILWELLVGPPLFSGATEEEAVAAVLTREIPPPSSLRKGIPQRLDAIVMKALQRDPRRRYQDAETMAVELGRGLRTRIQMTDHGADLIADLTGTAKDDSLPMSTADRTTRSADFSSSTTAVRTPPGRTPTPTPVGSHTSTSTRLLDMTPGPRTPRPVRTPLASSRLTPKPQRPPHMPPPLPGPRSDRAEGPPRPSRSKGKGRQALSGYIEGPATPVHVEPPPEELVSVSIPVAFTPTEPVGILGPPPPPGAPVFGRRPTLGLGQTEQPRPLTILGPSQRPTAIVQIRRSVGVWYAKLGVAAVAAAIAGWVWVGRGSFREQANAAPAGPNHRPEIMTISGENPTAQTTATKSEAANVPVATAPASGNAPTAGDQGTAVATAATTAPGARVPGAVTETPTTKPPTVAPSAAKRQRMTAHRRTASRFAHRRRN